MKQSTPIINPFLHRFKVRNFSDANNLVGWFVFSIALVAYLLTMEETASYWDPGEFIAVSYKLQVPHPPGAPLFLLLGRMFSFLSFGDVTRIAYAINLLSVLASALTILFLYWSIVLFGRKLIVTGKQSLTLEKQMLLIGAGAVGSLTYTFSDSFWFSAVEAEVYALSTLFTAFGVWAILKWELIEEKRKANRWLLLIAYMIGLSIGVHMLNLLTLPAIALIYYFKTFKTTNTGILATLGVSGCIVVLINNVLIPGLPSAAGEFEIFFVNTLGLFFGSGAIVFFLLVASSLVYGIYYTHMKNYAAWNTVLLGISFVLIGYGSYTTIIVRAGYDTPINENAPKDVMSFVRYVKREQYQTWPILYGPYFTARPIDYAYGSPRYIRGKDKYEISAREIIAKYKPGDETILPRAWNPDHKDDYMRIMGLKEGQRPTFAQNLYYMFRHQVGTMYVRYFMWNFAGRQSDEDGAGWLTPKEWFKDVPAFLADNKARNNFFMIPFLLGLTGMFFQFTKDTKNFSAIAVLFFMLGAAIVIYLNSPPAEPRERDYIYAGSYYAFAIWIGIGIIGMAEGLIRYLRKERISIILILVVGSTAPALMAFEGWDDHDRSDRFFSVDAATNSLNSCEKGGIIFTGGDNDTFPLWYAQEAEGCRTDLRVLVLSYCNTDWYIDQTTRQAYESSPFTYTLPAEEYRYGGPNDVLYYVNANIERIDVEEYLALLARKFPGLRNRDQNILPSRLLTLRVDKDAVLGAGMIPAGMENLVVDQMEFRLLGDRLEKRDLVFLDLLVTTRWKRPIYLNPTSMAQMNIDLKPYAVQVGNAYLILPVKNPRKDRDYLVDTGKTYDLLLNQFKYRGLDDPGIYYTDDYKIQVLQHRSNLNSLAEALIDEGKIEKAKRALGFSLDKMPDKAVPYDPSVPDTVNLLFKVGEKEKAVDVAVVAWNRSYETASWLVEEEGKLSFELRKSIFLLDSLQRSLYLNGEVARATEMESRYENLMGRLESAVERGGITE